MRRTVVVPSLAVVVASGAWVACSSSSSSGSPSADTSDASTVPDTSTPYDAALPPDDADVAETAPPPVRAKLTFVNATAGLFPVRFCFGVETPPELLSLVYPWPNSANGAAVYPALFAGTAQVFPDLTDLSAFDVTLYAIDARKIASDTSTLDGGEVDCPTLLGSNGAGVDGGALVPNVDFIHLATIPEGTFAHGASFVAVLEGCNPDPDGTLGYSTALCGSDWVSGAGNVKVQLFQVDDSTPAATALGLQVIHASSAWDGLLDAGGQATASTFGLFDDAVDGGALTPVAQDVRFGSITPADAASPQTIVAADYASSGMYTLVTAADGGALVVSDGDGGTTLGALGPYPFSFGPIQAASGYATAADGGAAGPLYVAGASFTAVWVGDPRQPAYVGADGGALAPDAGGAFNPAAPHFLLLPSDPVVPSE